ncbi:hypothetical protein R1flu_024717 [Riccia fluitans]|uniref:CST complex subunit STN1 n=1 Tax=Riccia fluitans TaxID=41844 RepID=A0ABD1XVQ4_9MARC
MVTHPPHMRGFESGLSRIPFLAHVALRLPSQPFKLSSFAPTLPRFAAGFRTQRMLVKGKSCRGFDTDSLRRWLELRQELKHSGVPLVELQNAGSGSALVDAVSMSVMRLLAFDLLSVQHRPGPQGGIFCRKGRPVKKVEMLGLVVSVDRRDSYVSFKLDDGTGCVPCILWTNHYKSSYFAHWRREELELQAAIAESGAKNVKLGCLLRVMGRLSGFRSQLQITVLSLHEEKDPNAEVFHWLQCMKLALQSYDSSCPQLAL